MYWIAPGKNCGSKMLTQFRILASTIHTIMPSGVVLNTNAMGWADPVLRMACPVCASMLSHDVCICSQSPLKLCMLRLPTEALVYVSDDTLGHVGLAAVSVRQTFSSMLLSATFGGLKVEAASLGRLAS